MDVTNWRDGWEVDGKGPDPAGPAPLQFPSIPALPKAPPTQETVLAIVSQLTSRYGFGKKKPNEDDTIRVPVLRRMAQRNKQQRFEENKQ